VCAGWLWPSLTRTTNLHKTIQVLKDTNDDAELHHPC
jgi:hypothetical protein